MKKLIITALLLVSAVLTSAQGTSDAGIVSAGSRSTLSLFNHGGGIGTGMGGQFRIQIADRVNTEWYLDYITSQSDNILGRKDLHIGWSVFYYYLKNNATSTKLLQPFFEIGHCFDHTFVNEIGTSNFAERWSSAAQLGTGITFNLTPKFDFTAKTQYMIHLGSDIDSEIVDDGHDHQHVTLSENKGVDLEGHLLVSLSLNYKIFHLWRKK